jgi:8-oxo-dGTP diphosphatase
MGREYPDNPLVGVGAVIVQSSRVLLVRRGQAPLLGEWSLPGGLLECGETLREGVAREVREETGLGVQTGELLGVYERVVPGEDGRVRYHYILIDFLCNVLSGELQAGSDAAEIRWFRADELNGLGLAEDTAEVIAKGLARKV